MCDAQTTAAQLDAVCDYFDRMGQADDRLVYRASAAASPITINRHRAGEALAA
jgi:hypothetical protein